MSDHKANAQGRANLTCFVAMLLWAAGFPAGEILLEDWGVLTLLLVRLTLSVGFLVILWIALEGMSVLREAPWRGGLIVGGVAFGFGVVLFLAGQKLSDAVTPAIAAAMMPVVGAVLEKLFDGKKLTVALVLGIILALAGGVLAAGIKPNSATFGWGALLCLSSVVFFGWGTRETTKRFSGLSALGQTTITLAGALVFVLFATIAAHLGSLGETGIGTIGGWSLFHMFVFAILSLAVAQFLWIRSAGDLGILFAAFHMNAVPFYVMLIIFVLMGGDWNWLQAAGAVLVATGVFVSQDLGMLTFRHKSKPELENSPCRPGLK